MTPPVLHKSFTLERTCPVSPARVFKAMSDPRKKRRWFAEGEGFIVDSCSLDFRVGGFERTRFRFGDGPAMTNDCVYLDIVEDTRLVFACSMTFAGAPMSSSLGSMEFLPVASGTLLRLTGHTALVDGKDGSEGRRTRRLTPRHAPLLPAREGRGRRQPTKAHPSRDVGHMASPRRRAGVLFGGVR